MTKNELNDAYLEWMYRLVCDDRPHYQNLLNYLHGIDFSYTICMDGNRAEDGVNLRYRFGYENDYPDSMIASYLDDRPCSVLEMMVALAVRCEEHIMDDPDIGDRTGQWFWNMIENLGLEFMCDPKFDARRVDESISRFLKRKYGRDGNGGLFKIKECKHDLRSVEIWYQMCWFLDSIT